MEIEHERLLDEQREARLDDVQRRVEVTLVGQAE